MLSKKMLPLVAASLLVMGLTGCATPLSKSVNDIQPGMEKSDVVDLAGGPHRKRRAFGHDVWTYIHYEESQRSGTVVEFKNGIVVAVRPARLTTKAIEAEDKLNYESYTSFLRQQRAEKTLSPDDQFIEIE